MGKIKTTNILLLIIVIPVIFYLLKILSFIFIPLTLSMFIALLFLPMARWFDKRNVPKPISIIFIILVIASILLLGFELIQLSSREILSSKDLFLEKAEVKIVSLINSIEDSFGINRVDDVSILLYYSEKVNILKNIKIGWFIEFVSSSISMTLMTVFFVVLWLSESINFQKVLDRIIFNQKTTSIKVFIKIENDLITFIKVKFIISLVTGIGIGLACFFFDVSFPIFWGLFAFVINFIQMIGSVISVVFTGLFSIIELDPTGSLPFFILTIIAVQVLMGGILEPVFMGKSFSINIIAILVMLMFWGYIWGIPGMIMSIPITVFLKILLDQITETQVIEDVTSDSEKKSI